MIKNNNAESLFLGGGLSNSLVLQRHLKEGYNELPTTAPKRFYSIVYNVLKEPMVYLLLLCGVIYFILGDKGEATMLLGFLALIIGITISQEAKAERALQALKEMSSPRALVLRNGKKERISGREVVRDDILFLNEGDHIAADAEIISSDYLSSNESLITGESNSVDKANGKTVYAGATIVSGQGVAIVTAIGQHTEIGKIGKAIQTSEIELTPLEKQANVLVKRLSLAAVLICLLVVVTYALRNGDWLDGSLAGLSLAMAIMPNELPAVLTIFFALGAWRLSQRRVLTRKLSAVENLGATTALCIDKTGTLTLNKMRIQKIYSQGKYTDLFHNRTNNIEEEFHEVLEFGILASKKDPFDPMEKAFISAGSQYLNGTEHLHTDWSLKKEYPISPDLLTISYAWKPYGKDAFVIGGKGAPEAILNLCHLSPEVSRKLTLVSESMAQEGLRVLGVAKAFTIQTPLPEKQHDFNFEFVGFIGIVDPIRSEVPAAIRECQNAGIRIIMLTGDHPKTAQSIAKLTGISNPDFIITGSEIEEMPEDEFKIKLKTTNIFSRIMPEQKLKIVRALQESGEIVAMTGDGVNDAPALKSANIGIAMGERGTDVAREASHLVLLDDDFSSIVESIKMGRRIFTNLRGALFYLFAIHIPIAGVSILPVFLGYPLIFFPAHIAFIHLIIEPVSSIAFETEATSPKIMTQPPRKKGEKLINQKIFFSSLTTGMSILSALVIIYFISLKQGQDDKDARALVFTTLIIANLALIFNSRGPELSFKEKFKTKINKSVIYISAGSIVLLYAVLFNSTLQNFFDFSLLHPVDLVICTTVGLISVFWRELFRKKTNGHVS